MFELVLQCVLPEYQRKNCGSLLLGSVKFIRIQTILKLWNQVESSIPRQRASKLVIELFRFLESERQASRRGRGELRKRRSSPERIMEPITKTSRPLAAKVRKNKFPSFQESDCVKQRAQNASVIRNEPKDGFEK